MIVIADKKITNNIIDFRDVKIFKEIKCYKKLHLDMYKLGKI